MGWKVYLRGEKPENFFEKEKAGKFSVRRKKPETFLSDGNSQKIFYVKEKARIPAKVRKVASLISRQVPVLPQLEEVKYTVGWNILMLHKTRL